MGKDRLGAATPYLVVCAIVLMTTAMLSHSWARSRFTYHRAEDRLDDARSIDVGLYSTVQHFIDHRTTSHGEQDHGSEEAPSKLDSWRALHEDLEWTVTRYGTLASGGLAMLTLAGLAIAAMMRPRALVGSANPDDLRSRRRAPWPVISSCLHATALLGAALSTLVPRSADFVIGHAPALFIVGALCGLLASVALRPIPLPPPTL